MESNEKKYHGKGLVLTRRAYADDLNEKRTYIEGGGYGPICIEIVELRGGQVRLRIRGDKRYVINRGEKLGPVKINKLEKQLE